MKIGEIFRGNSEYIISLSISCAILTVVSLLVGTSLVFDFLVTSAVNCTECKRFLPLVMKSVIDFCILGLGVLGFLSASMWVLLSWAKLLGGCESPVIDLGRFGHPG